MATPPQAQRNAPNGPRNPHILTEAARVSGSRPKVVARITYPLENPARMPLTRLANTIIDGVVEAPGAVAAEVERYLACDLVFYRAEGPEGLVEYWLRGYDLLVHVPIVDQPSPDGVRSADPGFQYAVEEKLCRELAERGLAALHLDPGARPSWLDMVEKAVWERLRPAQLPLSL